ncbi:riboflavin synthase [Solibacillus sp. FSL H8-0538]|uniref:riboflavin synthase n=1 Tax=Solibacillus sp. FSL H8-0538 TaxID=2921400 RepID=UPI0030F745A9
MFTGIIEEVGKIVQVKQSTSSMQLQIEATTVVGDVTLGDSIAVNGVCLTVTSFTKLSFVADVMPETFYTTTLKQLKSGQLVNLERAMPMNGRFGGHIVSGHVDGIGTIIKKRPLSNAVYLDLRLPKELIRGCIKKGSVTIDGTSLTIFDVRSDGITVSLIPHTYKETIFANKAANSDVNIETDIVGKYIGHFMQQENQLSADFLRQHGF